MYPNGTLVILDVQRKEDAAGYTCVARNDEGYSARSELEVTVMGKLMNFSQIIWNIRWPEFK